MRPYVAQMIRRVIPNVTNAVRATIEAQKCYNWGAPFWLKSILRVSLCLIVSHYMYVYSISLKDQISLSQTGFKKWILDKKTQLE